MTNKITTDFAGNETLAVTKTRIGEIVAAYGYDADGYSTWGDARDDLNDALTLASQSAIGPSELASSFRPKLNFLNTDGSYNIVGLRPELVLDFEEEFYRADAVSKTFANAITHTRASTATYVDSTGTLQTAAINEPRLGHHVWNGTAWVNEGLLHESEARTNLYTNSGDMDGGNWSSFRSTFSNGDTAPDGSQLFLLAGASETNANGSNAAQQVATLAAGTYTMSAFAKAGPDDAGFLVLRPASNVTFTDTVHAWFNLETGSVGTVSSSSGSSVVTTPVASIQDYGNGVYRCILTFTITSQESIRHLHYIADASGSFAVTIGKQVQLWGAQLEAAPTPSSYIPTAGSTVTRSADVLTIPAANLPYPEPVVIGPELVTNGTFDTDVSGWADTSNAGGSIAWNPAGYLDVINSTGTGRANQDIAVTAGAVYAITVQVVSLGGSSSGGVFLDTSASPAIGFATFGVGTHTIYYVAPDSLLNISARNFTTGTTVSIDNISVREINPLALSIQMDGRVTYADNNSALTATFISWLKDSATRIQTRLDTDGLGTGGFVFIQEAKDITEVLVSQVNTISPDILAPFNISSRHGSTFINGAFNGTALTADLTPVALPDLSATNLTLGQTYNGTIRTFRMWGQDIQNQGLVEATS